MNEQKELLKQIMQKDKQIDDLHVLIDTLQTNLRSAVSMLDEDSRDKIERVQSYRWVMGFRRGDELN